MSVLVGIKLPNDAGNTGGKLLASCKITVSGTDYYARAQVINDPVNDLQSRVLDTAPTGTEAAVVTRNIPSGTQAISGAITIPGAVTVAIPVAQEFPPDADVKEMLLRIVLLLEEIRAQMGD